MPVTGAADRAPERIALLVYIDALVPASGQSALDLLPEGFGAVVRAAADQHGHGWVAIPDAVLPPEGLIDDDIRARYVARLRDQPVAMFTEPIHLTDAAARVRRAFIRCTSHELDVGGDPIEPMAARARAEGWPYLELRAPHDPHLFDPTATADVLNEPAAVAVSDKDTEQLNATRHRSPGGCVRERPVPRLAAGSSPLGMAPATVGVWFGGVLSRPPSEARRCGSVPSGTAQPGWP